MFGFGKTRRPLDAIEKFGLDDWLVSVGLAPSGVRYNVYRGSPITETMLSTCVAGIALAPDTVDANGGTRSRGFCVEMYQGRVYDAVLMEARYAIKDKSLAKECQAYRVRMLDAFRQIVPHEDWVAPVAESSMPEGVMSDQLSRDAYGSAVTPREMVHEAAAHEGSALWGRALVSEVVSMRDRGEISASDASFRLASEYYRAVEAAFVAYDDGELTSEEIAIVLSGGRARV